MLTSLLDQYWDKTMADAERKVILADWVDALDDAPLDAVKKARTQWLVDLKRGHRAPKISEFLALVYSHSGRRPAGALGVAPPELARVTGVPWDKRSPAEKWSSYARLHAFFDATGRTNPRPVDDAMNYYDIDLVGMATSEAQINGNARIWVQMRLAQPEEPANVGGDA